MDVERVVAAQHIHQVVSVVSTVNTTPHSDPSTLRFATSSSDAVTLSSGTDCDRLRLRV